MAIKGAARTAKKVNHPYVGDAYILYTKNDGTPKTYGSTRNGYLSTDTEQPMLYFTDWSDLAQGVRFGSKQQARAFFQNALAALDKE